MKGNVHGGKLGKDRICIGVYIAKDFHAKLLEIAKAKELSLSDVFRIAVKEYLAKEEA
jgi:hypothetical protein